MSAPPVAYATSSTRCNDFAGTETERLKSAARTILWNVGIEYGPNKINRLVVTFSRRVERNGFEFFDFLANAVQLDAATRRRALAAPDVQRVIQWADKTGEDATRNLDRVNAAAQIRANAVRTGRGERP